MNINIVGFERTYPLYNPRSLDCSSAGPYGFTCVCHMCNYDRMSIFLGIINLLAYCFLQVYPPQYLRNVAILILITTIRFCGGVRLPTVAALVTAPHLYISDYPSMCMLLYITKTNNNKTKICIQKLYFLFFIY